MKRLVIAALLATAAVAQQPAKSPAPKIEGLVLLPGNRSFGVLFSEKVKGTGDNLKTSNVKVTPDTITVLSVEQPFASPNLLTLVVADPIEKDTDVKVVFDKIEYPNGNQAAPATNVRGDGTALTHEEYKAAFLKNQASAKKSDEKNIFASGFVTTAKGGSEGGADIALNPDLGIKNMTSFLIIKKTSLEGSDPKNFEAGVRYRGVFPTSRAMFAEIGKNPADTAAIMRIVDRQKKTFWNQLVAGTLLDFAGKLEGQATNFDVSNFVGETSLQWRTKTKRLGGPHGFWRGYLLPAGLEGGRSLNEESADKKVDWLARYKGGLGFTAFYENWKSELPIRRVELDANGVMRTLFFDEHVYDSTTKTTERTGKGVRGYGQVDLKLYVGESAKGRYGIKLTYNRGSLPPVYARVKSFQFGFLWESTDDAVKGK